MDWIITALGAALVVVVLWDIFHTLWHTSGQGRIAHFVLMCVWRLTALIGRRGRTLSGPLAMVGVIGTWGGLIVLGWTLIYYPHMPEDVSYEVGLDPFRAGQVIDALYMSLVTLATLGYGDIVPTAPWLRVVSPVQALIGFGLLTAAVSWVLQVYPALSRRRVLALRIDMIERNGFSDLLGELRVDTVTRTLDEIATGLAQVRIDLDQYAETYYFRDGGQHSTLAAKLGHVLTLSERASLADSADIQYSASVLDDAVHKLAELLDRRFLKTGGSVDVVLNAYAEQQQT